MPPVPEDVFIACIDAVVRLNAEFVGPHETEAILYIRPLLIADGPQLAIEPPSTFTFAVYVQPGISLHGIRPLDCLVMEEFDRAAPRGTGAVELRRDGEHERTSGEISMKPTRTWVLIADGARTAAEALAPA